MSLLKLISFLGTNDYLPCIYQTEMAKASPHRFIQTALVEILMADRNQEREVIIFLTEGARTRNWSGCGKDGQLLLEDELAELLKKEEYAEIRVRTVDVSEGFSTSDMWSIFQIVEQNVDVGDQVIFDITHSFRSLPFLSLLLLNYARVFREIKIEGIVYGAFEALGRRDTVQKMPMSERLVNIVDLKEFVKLLDWSVAADHFVKAGDTQDLYRMAKAELSPLKAKFKATDENLNHLNWLIQNLNNFSQQAATCRTRTILRDTIPRISNNAVMAKNESEPYVKALLPILDVVRGKMAGMLDGNDIQKINALVRWCLEHNKIQQAWTILRENVISYLCSAVEYKEHGLQAECGWERDLITKAGKVLASKKPVDKWEDAIKKQPWIVNAIRSNSKLLDVAKLLDGITPYRNDLDHAEYTCENYPANRFKTILEQTLTKFERLINIEIRKSTEKEIESKEEKQETFTRILLSPLGLSPGLLFSALRQLTPQHALVLSSKDAVGSLRQIVQHADYQGVLQEILVHDPFTCFEHVSEVEAPIIRTLSAFSNVEIWVSITGGTTALQYLVQKVASNLKEEGYLIHELAFADRRSAEEQKRVPFVEGEMFILS
ncbi:MAG: TIGR02221 family CRISPR-associated protein [Desulfitobacteriaceae bacterium]|nr:TIGR02221 family CRISPR-associated protein [Desulfitobacteriaceae bacterium]MDI6915134.1 TIGR02221 family CRISPR-associated protein [Desulfitobacteriaceae bacterium]